MSDSTDNADIVTTSSSSSQQAAIASSSSVEASISSAIASSVTSVVQDGSTVTVEPSTTNVVTSIISASPLEPTTQVFTSVVTQSASSDGSVNTNPVTVVVTSTGPVSTTLIATDAGSSTTSAAPSSTSSGAAALANNGAGGNGGSGSGGLGTAGKTAVAVVVPVVVVALLVLAGLFFWRRRKQKKEAEEQRRKEIQDYGFNPNNDPTLPTVASESPEMSQDHSSGYRGWGGAAAASRKKSTTLSDGHTQGQLSDAGNSYHSPSSPGGANSDGHSSDPLVNRRETMNSDELGALGAGPLTANNAGGMRRGPSNASSHYSNGARSENSDEPVPQIPSSYENHYNPGNYGYGQAGPYGDGSYGGGQQESGMPVVRDVSARRNTRIQQGGNYGQGNSGIAQNF